MSEVPRLAPDLTTESIGGNNMTATPRVLVEIGRERIKQDQKWGEQNHPNGTGPDIWWMLGLGDGPGRRIAARAKSMTDRRAKAGSVTWRDILIGEVAEAFAESDPLKLRGELIQVAAVATQWVEAIDRVGGLDPGDRAGGVS
jgi:hypothetical protein